MAVLFFVAKFVLCYDLMSVCDDAKANDMEQDRLDELTEMRFRHFERFSSAMIESQQEMMRQLTENTKQLAQLAKRVENLEERMDKFDERLTRVEELQTLALDDLAFIKEILRRDG